jgi:hypothetical protein
VPAAEVVQADALQAGVEGDASLRRPPRGWALQGGKRALTRRSFEPRVGVEPTTYALRGRFRPFRLARAVPLTCGFSSRPSA